MRVPECTIQISKDSFATVVNSEWNEDLSLAGELDTTISICCGQSIVDQVYLLVSDTLVSKRAVLPSCREAFCRDVRYEVIVITLR